MHGLKNTYLVAIHRKFYQHQRLWNLFVLLLLTYIQEKQWAFEKSCPSFKDVIFFKSMHRPSKEMTYTITFYNSRSNEPPPKELSSGEQRNKPSY